MFRKAVHLKYNTQCFSNRSWQIPFHFKKLHPVAFENEKASRDDGLLRDGENWHIATFVLGRASMGKVPLEIKATALGDEGYIANFYIPHTYMPNEPIHYQTQQDFNVGFYLSQENEDEQEYLITINSEKYKISGPKSYLARPEFGRLSDNMSEIFEGGETVFYRISDSGKEEMSEQQAKDFAWRENSYRALMEYVTEVLPASHPNTLMGE